MRVDRLKRKWRKQEKRGLMLASWLARFGKVISYSFRRKNTNDLCNFPVRFYKDDDWAVEVACALRLNPLIPKYE